MKLLQVFLTLSCGLLGTLASAIDYPSRLVAATAATQPYSLIGQVFFNSGNQDYIGSGTVIRPSSILTAGHNLYDPDGGWSTEVLFRRGAYGKTVLTTAYASRLYLLSGYRTNANTYGQNSVRTFAADSGGVLFAKQLASGAYAGWTTNTALLLSPYTSKIAVGYGAETHSGDYPLYVSPDRAFYSTYGAFWESRGAYFEGGMSGGPIMATSTDGKRYVVGVIVSGTDAPYAAGGVRVLNSTTATFIQTYLK